jgi:hypothetical protein
VVDPASFPALLCLSRKLNAFITPLRYSKIGLTAKFLNANQDSPHRRGFLNHLARHCKEVVLFPSRVSLHMDEVTQLLLKLQCLRIIRFVELNFIELACVNSSVLQQLASEWRKTLYSSTHDRYNEPAHLTQLSSYSP